MLNKRHFWIICGVVALLVVMTMPLWANTLSSAVLLRKHTFGNGGGQMQSDNYVLHSSFGQPSVVGELDSANLRLQAGYLAGTGVSNPVPPDPDPSGYALYLPIIIR